MSTPSLGSMLIVLGLGLALIGLAVSFGLFGWFGRLPGDIRIERESVRVYFPITSMIVVSIVLSLVFYIVRRFF